MFNWVKTAMLMAAITALFGVVGASMGGQQGMLLALGFALVTNFLAYWFSDRIVLRMYNAREVDASSAPEFYAMVRTLAERAELPMPKVYLIDEQAPNAFATGRNPEHAAVAATEGLIRMLSPDELDGVLAHELAHVKNRDILISSIAATIAAAIMMLARMAQFAAMFGGARRDDEGEGTNPIALLAMMIVAPLAAMLIQAAISRSREFLADAGGAAIAGSPMGLVNALQKIERGVSRIPMDANPATAHMFIMKPFSARGLMGLFSSHPPTEDRINALMGRS